MLRLMAHDYPGNVRELENIIEHAFVLCRSGLIEMHHLPAELCPASQQNKPAQTDAKTLRAMEELMIYDALQRHRGNRRRASKELGIDTSTLYRKIRDLKIDTPTTDGRSRTGKGTR
jgi:DNA-binding NtrC family response regulator